MNGCMLGMRRREIQQRFDEIVGFSEVEKFLDTPVKHYSSGMYMRLAFAVAAYLDPEILIVDEVLSVGDASFQKKCLNKLEAVSKNGRTVLVVSHALPVIQSKCQSCIWLDQGRLRKAGPTADVLTDFVKTLSDRCKTPRWRNAPTARAPARFALSASACRTGRGNDVPSLVTGEDAVIVAGTGQHDRAEAAQRRHLLLCRRFGQQSAHIADEPGARPGRRRGGSGHANGDIQGAALAAGGRAATAFRWPARSTAPWPTACKTPAPSTLRAAISTAPANRSPRVTAPSCSTTPSKRPISSPRQPDCGAGCKPAPQPRFTCRTSARQASGTQGVACRRRRGSCWLAGPCRP